MCTLTIQRPSIPVPLPLSRGGTGATTAAGARQMLALAPVEALGWSGMQVNGGMEVSQEVGTIAVSVTSAASRYPADQTFVQINGTAVVSAQQVTDAPLGYGNSLRSTITTTQTSLGGTDGVFAFHYIEGVRMRRLAFGTASATPLAVACWVKSSVAGSYGFAVQNGNFTRSYVTPCDITTANVWEYKTFLLPGDTTGTWTAGTGRGLLVSWALAAGTTFQTAADAWQAGGKYAPSGSTNLAATNGATFQVTGLLVVPGTELPDATRAPLVMRPFPEELTLRQRYWEKSYDYATALGAVTQPGVIVVPAPTTTLQYTVRWQRKRTTPTLTVYNYNTGASGTISVSTGGSIASVPAFLSETGYAETCVTTASLVYYWHWVANARL